MQAARKAAGFTQDVLAERLGVEQTTVSAWENGRAFPSMDRFLDFARVTGLDVEALMAELLAVVA